MSTYLDLLAGREWDVADLLLVLSLALLRGVTDERHEVSVEVTPQQRLVARDGEERGEQLGSEVTLEHLHEKKRHL